MALSTLLAAVVAAVLARAHSNYQASEGELALANPGKEEGEGLEGEENEDGLKAGEFAETGGKHLLLTPFTSGQRAKPSSASFSEGANSYVVPMNVPDELSTAVSLSTDQPANTELQAGTVNAAFDLTIHAAKTDEDLAELRAALADLRLVLTGRMDRLDEGLQAAKMRGAELTHALEQTSSGLAMLREQSALERGPGPVLAPAPAPDSASVSKADISNLSGRIEGTKSEIFALGSALDDTNAAVADAAKSLVGISEQILALRASVEGSHDEISRLRRDIAAPFLDDSEW